MVYAVCPIVLASCNRHVNEKQKKPKSVQLNIITHTANTNNLLANYNYYKNIFLSIQNTHLILSTEYAHAYICWRRYAVHCKERAAVPFPRPGRRRLLSFAQEFVSVSQTVQCRNAWFCSPFGYRASNACSLENRLQSNVLCIAV